MKVHEHYEKLLERNLKKFRAFDEYEILPRVLGTARAYRECSVTLREYKDRRVFEHLKSIQDFGKDRTFLRVNNHLKSI